MNLTEETVHGWNVPPTLLSFSTLTSIVLILGAIEDGGPELDVRQVGPEPARVKNVVKEPSIKCMGF